MKSSRYEILPRLRKMNQHIEGAPLYKCTWKAPGKKLQYRGKPLQYDSIFVGIGNTPDEAITNCQLEYAKFQISQQKQHNRAWYGDGRYVGNKNEPDVIFEPSDTIYKATSNLPWWKRLFRV